MGNRPTSQTQYQPGHLDIKIQKKSFIVIEEQKFLKKNVFIMKYKNLKFLYFYREIEISKKFYIPLKQKF